MAITQSWYHLRIPSLLFVLLIIGCGDKGVRLDGFVPGTSNGIASLTIGDGGTCTAAPCTITNGDWNDSFITPNGTNSFTVAMKSAALIKENETAPSYTVFDSGDIAKPVIQSFSPGTTQTFGTNTDPPVDGAVYDRIQYVVSYYEMVIPVTYPGQSLTQRRVRLYLGTFTDPTLGSVFQNDILIDNLSGALNWINPSVGIGGFLSSRPSTPNLALQVMATQLDVNTFMGSVVTSTGAFTDGDAASVPLPYLIAQLSTSLAASETTTFTINYIDQDGNPATAPPFTINNTTPLNTDIIVPLAAGHTRIQNITSITNSPTTTTAATVQFSGIGGVDTPVTDPYTFTFPLNTPLNGSSDKQFVIQLAFDTTKIFFFDETNGTGIVDPVSASNNNNFNPVTSHCTTDNSTSLTNEACDGRLDANPPANFWPGLPAVTAELK